ncbi:GDSL esterase/lipase [Rhynchospora pubera]|uniref:GDSL esterase/lipase n=1 Tax=Rhynchospora pubera TaxID=906938 RepID=A0AAV8FL48_9POAL|nr:GDSL esterase/lipase [Rhynchospora pubera]
MPMIRSSVFLFLALFLVFRNLSLTLADDRCYSHFFVFGDSISDNGNWLHYAVPPGPVARLPYGETFFKHPTGRFSDGRLIIDFICEALDIPYLTPYLVGNTSKDFQFGANFAVGGATALNQDYFKNRGLQVMFTPYSLGTQIRWFEKLLKLLGSSDSERKAIASTSLFLMGEIGGNDYNQPFLQNRPIEEIRTYVPDVIDAIGASANDLINLGAKTIVVPGNFPIGCVPEFRTIFQTNNSSEYDQYGCLKWMNEFAEYHNTALKTKLRQLTESNPGVTLIYADYYSVTFNFTKNPMTYGFENVRDACCGAGGPYNVNPMIDCGLNGSHTCPDPAKYISWDGSHMTEQVYKYIAHDILEGPYTNTSILAQCMFRLYDFEK